MEIYLEQRREVSELKGTPQLAVRLGGHGVTIMLTTSVVHLEAITLFPRLRPHQGCHINFQRNTHIRTRYSLLKRAQIGRWSPAIHMSQQLQTEVCSFTLFVRHPSADHDTGRRGQAQHQGRDEDAAGPSNAAYTVETFSNPMNTIVGTPGDTEILDPSEISTEGGTGPPTLT